MEWTELPGGGFADPYLTWTCATGWAGHAAAAGRPTARIPVLLALKPTVDLDALDIVRSGLVDIPGLYRYPNHAGVPRPRHCTASVARDRLAELAASPEIERFEFALPVNAGPVDQTPRPLLKERVGEVVIGIIDRGCAFLNTSLRSDWTGPGVEHTRIAALWDQSRAAAGPHWRRPAGVGYGRELDSAAIDALIAEHRGGRSEESIYRALDHLVGPDGEVLETAHGTHVADTLAGLVPPRAMEASAKPSVGDAAQRCRLIFVSIPSLAPGDTTGASSGAFLLDAVRYILDRAGPGARIVINVSLGIHAGPHDGSALIDQALHEILAPSMRHDVAITVAGGNGAEQRWSSTGALPAAGSDQRVWRLMPDDPTDSFLEVWWSSPPGPSAKGLEIRVTPPRGWPGSDWIAAGRTVLLERAPGQPACMMAHLRRSALGDDPMALFAIAPNAGARAAAAEGRWTVELRNEGDAPVAFDLWIQRDEPPYSSTTPIQSEFDDLDDARRGEGCEMNNLACGPRLIAVGAARLLDRAAAGYSAGTGSGARSSRLTGPLATGEVDVFGAADESARAIGLFAAKVQSGLSFRMGGTSTAAPVVARKLVNVLADTRGPLARAVAPSFSADTIKSTFLSTAPKGLVRQKPAFWP